MKTIGIRELSHQGASKAVATAQDEAVLITKSNQPVAWMVGAEQVARVAGRLDDERDIYHQVLAVVAADLFDKSHISIGKAAELSGIPIGEFILFCNRLHIPILREPPEGFAAELEGMEEVFGKPEERPSLACDNAGSDAADDVA